VISDEEFERIWDERGEADVLAAFARIFGEWRLLRAEHEAVEGYIDSPSESRMGTLVASNNAVEDFQ
jgi:hypothetical protein